MNVILFATENRANKTKKERRRRKRGFKLSSLGKEKTPNDK
jgi:hypothetical protein